MAVNAGSERDERRVKSLQPIIFVISRRVYFSFRSLQVIETMKKNRKMSVVMGAREKFSQRIHKNLQGVLA
jgi:hypothetical protein